MLPAAPAEDGVCWPSGKRAAVAFIAWWTRFTALQIAGSEVTVTQSDFPFFCSSEGQARLKVLIWPGRGDPVISATGRA